MEKPEWEGGMTKGQNSDLQTGLQSLQGQFCEMRDFLEVQLSLHRDLLERIANRGAPEHSMAVSPMFLGMRTVPSNGHDRTSFGSDGSLHTIQEDPDPDGLSQMGPAQKATEGARTSWSKFAQVPLSKIAYASQAQLRASNLQAKQLRLTTQAARVQFQKRKWRSCVKELIFSPWFSLAITFLILLNVVLLGVEVDVSATLALDEVPSWFGTVNALIVCIFVVEMLLKIFVLGCQEFWCGVESGWNIFDSLIVSLSVVDLVVDALASLMSASLDTGHLRFMRSIRIARAVRGIRVVRIFRYITALRTLALSIISTMSSLFWTLALLVLVFYLFAVVITQLVLDHCRHSACPELLLKFWGSVPESMLTLFMAITNGLSWDDALRPLRNVSYFAVALVVCYVTLAVFAILNVVTGVFCNTAIESAHADKEVATIKQVRSKDQQVESLRQVFSEIDNANRNLVTFEEMSDAISKGELSSFMEAMGISTDDIRTLYTLLDADKDGLIDLDEFVSGCMQLHGPAKSLQLAKMSFENKLARDDLKTLTQDFADFKSSLQVKQMVRSQNQKEIKESF
mmetsp:Transcript_5126/g.8612  ORF Transcript_5126/g.8612 Transcript_5126/m.8612 type:complete len:570 (+) Transcript_5126:43-1752(+)